MKIEKNILLKGSNNKPIALDIFYEENGNSKPVVIYAHGFNGFKDWANFDLIAKQFAQKDFVFVKFNFSHNGTSPDHPEEFTDLEAFGENNYTKELDDLSIVMNWCIDPGNPHALEINTSKLFLIGHSMGGGIVLLQAGEDDRVKRVATWASINECKTPWGSWSQEKMKDWKREGVQYFTNGRTKQEMPLHYQLFTDYENNRERLDIKKAISTLQIPVLVCHGSKDEAVPVEKAQELKNWQPAAQFFLVESDHIFGRKHPWDLPTLPEPMQAVVDITIEFFKSDN